MLSRSFYQRDTVTVAKDLIGKVLVRVIDDVVIAGRISETEAYGFKNDSASHTYRGITPRTQAMFGPVGCAYIYFSYGNHFCFNVVARAPEVEAGGVLIRALEPVHGMEYMMLNRKNTTVKNLANGPGKLTQALAINKDLYGVDVTQKGELFVVDDRFIYKSITATPRIGISSAQDKLWRFVGSD